LGYFSAFAALYYKNSLRFFVNLNNPTGTTGALTGTVSALFVAYWSRKYRFLHTFRIMVITKSRKILEEFLF